MEAPPPPPDERLYRVLVEQSLELVVLLDAHGITRFANQPHERALGYRPADLVGGSIFDIVHPDDRGRIVERYERSVADGTPSGTAEIRVRHRDGSWRLLECVARNLLDDPVAGGMVVVSRDVTERRRAEARTALLLDVARDLAGALEAGPALGTVLAHAARGVPCDMAAAWLFDRDHGVWRATGSVGLPDALAAQLGGLTFPPAQPFQGIVAGGRAIVVDDPAAQHWLPPALCTAFGVGPYVAAPMRTAGRHLGLLLLARRPGCPPFDAEQVELASGIAHQTATALAAMDVSRDQREETRVSAALARFSRALIAALDSPGFLDSLCAVTAEVFECDHSYTLLWNRPEACWFALAGHGSGVSAEALRLAAIPDALLATAVERLGADRPRSAADPALPDDVVLGSVDLGPADTPRAAEAAAIDLGMALRRGGELIGLQVVRLPPGRGRFAAWQLRVAAGVGKIASLGLERGRLIAELEQALRMRTDFLATMSHELRTPLNVILGYGEILRDGLAGQTDDLARNAVDGIDRNARELFELIENTLDLSRIERGRMGIQVEEVAPDALLEEVAREVRAGWNRPDVAFRVSVSPGLPTIRTDPGKLRIVVRNLLSNAVKFTERGAVTLEARRDDGAVVIAVADTGIGIDDESQRRIFEAFYQADAVRGSSGGVGLGLHIVQQLVALLGGDLTVSSRVGVGSRFTMRLPLEAPVGTPH